MRSAAGEFSALASADLFLLLVVLAHLTADDALVERAWAASQKPERSASDVPDALREEAVARLADFLRARSAPAPVSRDFLARLIQFCAGEPVPDEYLPMLLEGRGS